jgi:hypothetical protein
MTLFSLYSFFISLLHSFLSSPSLLLSLYSPITLFAFSFFLPLFSSLFILPSLTIVLLSLPPPLFSLQAGAAQLAASAHSDADGHGHHHGGA